MSSIINSEITVTMLTKNSSSTISLALNSLIRFSKVIILDTGSTDDTLKIAASYPNVEIHITPFTAFGILREEAAALAPSDWILFIDSDEQLTSTLVEEIAQLSLDRGTLYRMPRYNYFNGKETFQFNRKEPSIRLYNRKETHFVEEKLVHEQLCMSGMKIVDLQNGIIHQSIRSVSALLTKLELYSTLAAEERQHTKKGSIAQAILHGMAAFIKYYFLKGFFLAAGDGFVISFWVAEQTYYKYLKIAEINKKFLGQRLVNSS